MAPIKFKEIVTFSSQDHNNRAENLLKAQTQWNRWLCAPDDNSGCIQVEIQLERAERIGFIDIGNYGSSMVEVQVRRSYSYKNDFQALLPATLFRTVEESRKGRNKNGVRMFTKDHFIEGTRDQEWDRVKIICRVLSKKMKPFGLAFASFSSVTEPSIPKVDAATPPKAQVNIATRKGKNSKANVPAWKKDTTFYHQYLEKNANCEVPKSELEERILKMSSMSEDGTKHQESFSRSARMLLAASGSTMLKDATNYQRPADSTTPTEVKDGIVQFRRKLQAFIRKEGQGIAEASMKALRAKFEVQLGYKMDRSMKYEFKAVSMRAAECSMWSTNSPLKEGAVKRTMTNDETLERKMVRQGRAGPTKSSRKFPESKKQKNPPKRQLPKKELPASAYRNCPRCFRKYTTHQINFHVASCVPDHLQVARATLDSIAAMTSATSGKEEQRATTSTPRPKKGENIVQEKSPTVLRGSQNICVFENNNISQSSGTHSNRGSPSAIKISTGDTFQDFAYGCESHTGSQTVPCPICDNHFEEYLIEAHASMCGLW